jgi:hypothetical protein
VLVIAGWFKFKEQALLVIAGWFEKLTEQVL